MSLYSGAIVSDLIDPTTSVANKLVEFKLNPNTGYYSNLRVVNVGAKVAAKGYNPLCGVYGVLRAVYLYDGRKELDSLREANRYLGFSNLLYKNEVNVSQRHKITKSGVGYMIDEKKQISQKNKIDKNAGNSDQTVSTSNEGDETRLGYLDLRQALPILSNMVFLSTNTFKNLRVVLEFESDRAKVLDNNSAAFTVPAPILIADEEQDPARRMAMEKAMTGAVWNCIEHDIVQVPGQLSVNGDADTRSSEQSVTKKVDGFQNKNVSRVVVMKARADPTNYVSGNNVSGFGAYSSEAMHKEKFQVTLNNKTLFSGADGIDNEGHKAYLMAMTFGHVNVAPYDNLECVGSDSPIANSVHKTGVRPIVANKQANETGQLNYIGFSIEDRVQDLQIAYKRTNVKYTNGTVDQKLNAPLNLHIFAEVRKQLVVSGEKYEVTYA